MRQHTPPLLITRSGSQLLTQVAKESAPSERAPYDEAWLQKLIFAHPLVLPVSEIEPGFGTLIPVCLELSTGVGYADILFVTESGNLVVVECKLWRNSQARREVVAQILDYANAMSAWTCEDLDDAVRKARREPASLFQIASCASPDLQEAQFYDALTVNLRKGRILLIVAGDGIREGAEALISSIQSHAHRHLSLAMVELPVFRLPSDDVVIVPRVLTRTLNIERLVVRVEEKTAFLEPIRDVGISVQSPIKRTISLDQAMEEIDAHLVGTSHKLTRLAHLLERDNFSLEASAKSVILRWRSSEGATFNMGTFLFSGHFDPGYDGRKLAELGALPIRHDYMDGLARLLDGRRNTAESPENISVVRQDGKMFDTGHVLGHLVDFADLVRSYAKRLDIHLEMGR